VVVLEGKLVVLEAAIVAEAIVVEVVVVVVVSLWS
jgi:hypothetical protein